MVILTFYWFLLGFYRLATTRFWTDFNGYFTDVKSIDLNWFSVIDFNWFPLIWIIFLSLTFNWFLLWFYRLAMITRFWIDFNGYFTDVNSINLNRFSVIDSNWFQLFWIIFGNFDILLIFIGFLQTRDNSVLNWF